MCNSDFSRMGMLPEGVSPDSPTDTDQDAYNPYAPCPDCGKSFMSHDNPAKCDKL
jgi:hypothetical protein